ncbi:hypothetical protein [Streptomyces sp. NBC_01506]|uniref:hypothetical protein n=1 Tax=Streptomyces sp. NBC_01506 TaxID=2903887 RepID=UPI0038647AA5
MNGSPDLTGYWAEVRAEGPVYGTGEIVQHILSTFQTISPVLALRWVRGEAMRIVDRLDPDPERSAWVTPWMLVDPAPVPDGCAELSFWAEDPGAYQAARDQLREGAPLSVVITDNGCRYTLTVWPVLVPPPECVPTARVSSGHPTHGRSGHTSHRRARRAGWLLLTGYSGSHHPTDRANDPTKRER